MVPSNAMKRKLNAAFCIYFLKASFSLHNNFFPLYGNGYYYFQIL